MKYLWIGVTSSEEGRAHVVKNGGKLLSAEVSNAALLSGLAENGVTCDSINAPSLPAYPRYPEKTVKEFRWKSDAGAKGVSVSYKNLKYLNLYYKKRALVKEAKKWAKAHREEDVTVFVYQMHSPFMAAAKAVKRIIPRAKIVLIVPDLPQFMDLHMSRVKRVLKKIDWHAIRRLMKKVDRYVLYSRHMAEFLKLADGTWTVVEGSFDPSLLIEDAPKEENGKISVMYSGVLDLRYGIRELLDAFALLDENYELWLTGTGNAVPLIEERAKSDTRICYYGFLPSRRDLLKKQHEATMLISTRNPAEIASAYCFPSKIFEYMVSGNPVLSTRILGIPEEYFEHLIALDDIRPETLASKIRSVAEMPCEERRAFGAAAADFIIENKNNVAQTRRLLDFLGI